VTSSFKEYVHTDLSDNALRSTLGRPDRGRAAGIADGRYAQPEEVANLMLYLVSDLSSHITGQGMLINGGAF
jgi:NAD(P)-dependent dehydrogenase (short-subunit alcohol dehydrogenase family)